MEIVPIAPAHIAGFTRLILGIAREDIFAMRADSLSAEAVRRFVERQLVDGAPMFVAMDNDQLVGWCEVSLGEADFTAHTGVLSMGVLYGYRGQGVGSWLIRKCIAASRSMGLERIEISVLENNPKALDFYKQHGFVVEGYKRRSLRIGETYHDETLLAMLLNQAAVQQPAAV
ncbi:GNAT family N-acetyltransferase [Granulosicoccaceae sp. 1_MG-2023]|nr:GNAT family N-acetyltransferase [Granulosicoccaceae sp. 1_MG-2023]